MTPTFAIVILNWNTCEMLRQYLPCVLAASRSERFAAEVIVADNGSTDSSCEMMRKEFPDVRLLALSENYGFAGGYNRALRGLDADCYLLLNSDVRPAAGWLEPLYDFLAAHPDCAAVAPKLRSLREPEMFEYAGASGGFLDCWGYPFCRGRLLGTLEKDAGQYDEPCPVLWASGAALCVRRADWEAVGGLDEDFFAHQEEIDLCWRLHRRGRRVFCEPRSVVYHLGGATLSEESPRKTYLNFRNNLLMLLKNVPSDTTLRRILRWRRVLDAVAAAQNLLTGRRAHFQAIREARRDFRRMRPAFEQKRKAEQRAATCTEAEGIARYALLVQYYLRRHRHFSQLPPMR